MLHNKHICLDKIWSYLTAAIVITQSGKIVALLTLVVGLKLGAERKEGRASRCDNSDAVFLL